MPLIKWLELANNVLRTVWIASTTKALEKKENHFVLLAKTASLLTKMMSALKKKKNLIADGANITAENRRNVKRYVLKTKYIF